MKNFTRNTRSLAAWALVILAAVNILFNAPQLLGDWNVFIGVNKGVDDTTHWVNRFEQLKKDIPSNVRFVGYIAEDPQHVEFILTQYAIIPLVLQNGTGPEWIIANFPGQNIQSVLRNSGIEYDAIKDYGFGIYLVHKK